MDWNPTEIMKRVKAEMLAEEVAYSFETLKVGDYVQFYYTPYQHCATLLVTKINRVSFVGVERPGSYKAGREWKIHKDWRRDLRLVTAAEKNINS